MSQELTAWQCLPLGMWQWQLTDMDIGWSQDPLFKLCSLPFLPSWSLKPSSVPRTLQRLIIARSVLWWGRKGRERLLESVVGKPHLCSPIALRHSRKLQRPIQLTNRTWIPAKHPYFPPVKFAFNALPSIPYFRTHMCNLHLYWENGVGKAKDMLDVMKNSLIMVTISHYEKFWLCFLSRGPQHKDVLSH